MTIDSDLDLVDRIVRRSIPSCFEVLRTSLVSAPVGNPAPLTIEVSFQRKNSEPEPLGWAHELSSELRNGWDASDYVLSFHQRPSRFDDDETGTAV